MATACRITIGKWQGHAACSQRAVDLMYVYFIPCLTIQLLSKSTPERHCQFCFVPSILALARYERRGMVHAYVKVPTDTAVKELYKAFHELVAVSEAVEEIGNKAGLVTWFLG